MPLRLCINSSRRQYFCPPCRIFRQQLRPVLPVLRDVFRQLLHPARRQTIRFNHNGERAQRRNHGLRGADAH